MVVEVEEVTGVEAHTLAVEAKVGEEDTKVVEAIKVDRVAAIRVAAEAAKATLIKVRVATAVAKVRRMTEGIGY